MSNLGTTKTEWKEFFRADSNGTALFAVRPGVDAIDALESVSCFITSALRAAYILAESKDSGDEASGIAYLLELSSAVIESVLKGDMAAKRVQEGQP